MLLKSILIISLMFFSEFINLEKKQIRFEVENFFDLDETNCSRSGIPSFDSENNLYTICDEVIVKTSKEGKIIEKINLNEMGKVDSNKTKGLVSLYWDLNDNSYAYYDCYLNGNLVSKIIKFDNNWNAIWEISGVNKDRIEGIAGVDRQGNIYVIKSDGTINKYNKNGLLVLEIKNSVLSKIRGNIIKVNLKGELCIVDLFERKIILFRNSFDFPDKVIKLEEQRVTEMSEDLIESMSLMISDVMYISQFAGVVYEDSIILVLYTFLKSAVIINGSKTEIVKVDFQDYFPMGVMSSAEKGVYHFFMSRMSDNSNTDSDKVVTFRLKGNAL